jgi:hypothetical protein
MLEESGSLQLSFSDGPSSPGRLIAKLEQTSGPTQNIMLLASGSEGGEEGNGGEKLRDADEREREVE